MKVSKIANLVKRTILPGVRLHPEFFHLRVIQLWGKNNLLKSVPQATETEAINQRVFFNTVCGHSDGLKYGAFF